MAILSKSRLFPQPAKGVCCSPQSVSGNGSRSYTQRAASGNAETALLGVTTRKCSECTASWTKHERAARRFVRCTPETTARVAAGVTSLTCHNPPLDRGRCLFLRCALRQPHVQSGAAKSRKACSLRSTGPREAFRPNDFEPKFSGAIIANVSQVTP